MVLMSAFLVCFIIFAFISVNTLENLKVNGPIYKRIVQGKDLIADVLPPPEYVVESYLVALQMLDQRNVQNRDALIERIRTLQQDYESRHEFWVKELEDGDLKSYLVDKSYFPALAFYDLIGNKYIPALKANKIELAREIAYGELQQKYEEHRSAIDATVQAASARNAQDEKLAAETIRSRTLTMILLGVAGLGLVVVFSLSIYRSISRNIGQIVSVLQEGALQVDSASGQVASASQSLAEGTSEQASSLEETSASLEELGSMSRQNADNAREANNLSSSTSDAAVKGNEAMGRMSQAIADIKKSSDETAKIIKTIDEIAFQTNLLALNAAVEAARAGEAGKGFAVVAEEVRNLAMRSAEAARNTSNLIEGAQKNADNGVQVAQEVAELLGIIVTSVQKVTVLINEISAASDEQAKGVEQINQATSQMDKVTQENAANAEESASASEELNAQAQELKVSVQNLQRIVGGAGSSFETAAPSQTRMTGRPTGKAQHVKDQIHTMLQRKVYHRPAVKPGNGRPKGIKKTPEELIPLEENEKFEFEDAFKN
jgi:methyl-accepting chemotaxis protein